MFAATVLADCGPPVVPSSHVLVTSNSTLAGSVAVYSCVSGYVLLGDQFTKCQENGVWTQSYPRCTGNYKPNIVILDNSMLFCNIAFL